MYVCIYVSIKHYTELCILVICQSQTISNKNFRNEK